jgi:hypothetical protein
MRLSAFSALRRDLEQYKYSLQVAISVANWPKFRPHNSKGSGEKCVRPSKLAAEFSSNICQKGPKKGGKLLLSSFF